MRELRTLTQAVATSVATPRFTMWLLAAFATLALVLSLAASRVLESLLFGVGTRDPITFATVPAVLLAVTLLACYLPARRATRVDPVVALRSE